MGIEGHRRENRCEVGNGAWRFGKEDVSMFKRDAKQLNAILI